MPAAFVGLGPRIVPLDVTNPTTPAFRGQSWPLLGIPSRIRISDHFAYVAAGNQFAIMEIVPSGHSRRAPDARLFLGQALEATGKRIVMLAVSEQTPKRARGLSWRIWRPERLQETSNGREAEVPIR